jgi:hypothetical protein
MVSNGVPVCQSAAVAPGRGSGAPPSDLRGRIDYGVNSDRTARVAGGAGEERRVACVCG